MDQPKRPGGEYRPRSPEQPTRSQLLPVAANWREVYRKPYFLPAVITIALVIALFQFAGSPSQGMFIKVDGLPVKVPYYLILLAAYICVGSLYVIYRLVGKPMHWSVMAASAGLLMVLLTTGMPIFMALHSVTCPAFIDKATGGDDAGLVSTFINMFFCAGLPEEIYKGIPVAIAIWIGLTLKPVSGFLARAQVTEPLDAILIGAAAGVGFAFIETVGQYVPNTMIGGDFRQLAAIYNAAARNGPDAGAFAVQQAMLGSSGVGLFLMIPRLLANICGHAAYAGYFGYFLGLAALRRHDAWKTVAIGLASAAGIHALWNTFGSSGALLGFAVKVGAFAMLAAAITKARELSPNKDRLVPSQILDHVSELRGHMPPPPPPPAPAHAKPAPAAVSETWGAQADPVLEIGSARVPVAVGARIYATQTPGLQALGSDGVVAEVNANPNDPAQLGLKNLSSSGWPVTLSHGEQRDIAPGRSIRLASGTRIQLGDITAVVK
ncbi:PrsW family intramembrane metalloprotease [Methylibium sp.]|uniref:PrsW family intramembrane metalloprotease n=1 Tax=Methylibium sp. TaxID=2067992 RepID=UPI003D0FCE04